MDDAHRRPVRGPVLLFVAVLAFIAYNTLSPAASPTLSYAFTSNSDWQTGLFFNTTYANGDLVPTWIPSMVWLYRKPITITGSGSALTQFQVSVTITNETGKMSANYADIRFTDSDGVTLLPFWCENCAGTSSATFWVKVPSIPTAGTTIYAYYGNPFATDAQNGTGTFEFFDDFEQGNYNKWTKGSTATLSMPTDSTTYLKSTIADADSLFHTAAYPTAMASSLSTVYEGRVNHIERYPGISFRHSADNTFYIIYYSELAGGTVTLSYMNGGARTDVSTGANTVGGTTNTWEKFKLTVNDAGAITYLYRGVTNTWTNNVLPAGKIGFADYGYSGQGQNIAIDDVRVRKYAAAEPSATQSPEETGNWIAGGDWAYRKPVYISGSTSNLTDYQVNVTPYVYNETGLVGSWHFENNATDSSGFGNNANYVGAVRTTDGKFGKAMEFNGLNDNHIAIPDSPSLGIPGDITISLWVNPQPIQPSASTLISAANDYMIEQSNDAVVNGYSFTWYNGASYACRGSVDTQLTPGAWQHLVIVKSGATLSQYKNGVLNGTCTAATSNIATGGTLILGDIDGSGGNVRNFNGTLDEVRIYNRTLSATEIQQQYQATKARLDYQDIRFTDSDGVTPLPFWMESDGKFWVKVPSIPTTGTTIYAYYGNPSATDAQNGTGTFVLFDDFSDGDYTNGVVWSNAGGTGSWSASNKYMSGISGSSKSYYIATPFSQQDNLSWNIKVRHTGATTDYLWRFLHNDITWPTGNGVAGQSNGGIFFYCGGTTFAGSLAFDTAWHSYRITRGSDGWKSYVDGALMGSSADTGGCTASDFMVQDNGYPYDFDDVFVRKYASPEPLATSVAAGEEIGMRGSYISSPVAMSQQAGSITPLWSSSGPGSLSIEVSANNGTNWYPALNNAATAVASGSTLRFRANFTNGRFTSRLSDISLSAESAETPTPTPTSTPTGQPPAVNISGSPPSLNCAATSYNGTLLQSLTLYTNFTGGLWSQDQTKNVNGTSNSTVFQKAAPATVGNYSWNCLALDSSGLSAFASANATLIQNVSSAQATTLQAALLRPLSVLSGDTMSFTVGITGPYNETIVGIIPSVVITPQERVTNVTINPATLSLLPANSSANFTVTFQFPSSGQLSVTFNATGTSQQTAQAAQSSAVTSQLYVGAQFTLSLSSNKIDVSPNGGASIAVLARNSASFTREKVRLKLSNTACCSFSLTPNGVDIPAGSGATFTMTVSPVSTAQPGTVYTTGIIAYTDTEPSLALGDLTVSVLRDVVPETGAARERALSAIKNANDTIFFVDRQIADAEKKRLDTYQAATTLAAARGLYKDALALMDSSDYDGAYLKATDALTKAQSALTAMPAAPAAALTATVTKAQAEAYLRAANDTVFFVDTQIALAERQRVQLQEAVGKLAEARGLLKRAQGALDAGDYQSAADLSSQATALATSSLQSIPVPGQIPTTKLAIAAAAVLLIAAIIYLKFVRKQPPKPVAQYYQQPQYYGYRPAR